MEKGKSEYPVKEELIKIEHFQEHKWIWEKDKNNVVKQQCRGFPEEPLITKY